MTQALPSPVSAVLRGIGVVALLVAPFALLAYLAKQDTPEARERRIAKAYGAPRVVSSSRSGGYPYPASSADGELAPEPEVVGCWQVRSSKTPPFKLMALWLEACPEGALPLKTMGEHAMPFKSIYLPAWSSGLPKMLWARSVVVLSENLSDTEDTQAGLLYLPVARQGQGYVVAAWRQMSSAGSAISGIKILAADHVPSSVETSGGGVYSSEDNPYNSSPSNPGESANPQDHKTTQR